MSDDWRIDKDGMIFSLPTATWHAISTQMTSLGDVRNDRAATRLFFLALTPPAFIAGAISGLLGKFSIAPFAIAYGLFYVVLNVRIVLLFHHNRAFWKIDR